MLHGSSILGEVPVTFYRGLDIFTVDLQKNDIIVVDSRVRERVRPKLTLEAFQKKKSDF